MNIIIPISVFLAILSFALTYLIRRVAIKNNFLDIPNERSSHSVPVPRGGGLAIVVSWYIGISILNFLNLLDNYLYFALLSGVLLAIISLIDDILGVRPVFRIIVQSFTALVSLSFLVSDNPAISENGTTYIILFIITLVGIVWFINLFNFLDGIDGYSSMEALMIAGGMLLITGDPINLILIVCISGFLFWNWPKAKIFMGDVGSTQLGFILIILGLNFHINGKLYFVHWIMLSSLFWFDAIQTLARRWKNRENLSVAHKKHAYQRIVQAGFSHRKTVLSAILINCIILILVIVSMRFTFLIVPAFVLNLLILLSIAYAVDRKLPFKSVL